MFDRSCATAWTTSIPAPPTYEERYRNRVLTNLQRRAKSLGDILQEAGAESVEVS